MHLHTNTWSFRLSKYSRRMHGEGTVLVKETLRDWFTQFRVDYVLEEVDSKTIFILENWKHDGGSRSLISFCEYCIHGWHFVPYSCVNLFNMGLSGNRCSSEIRKRLHSPKHFLMFGSMFWKKAKRKCCLKRFCIVSGQVNKSCLGMEIP